MVDKFLRVPAVLEAAGFNRTTLYKLVAEGKFPKPVKPDGDSVMVRWLASEVADWQKARIAARDATNHAA